MIMIFEAQKPQSQIRSPTWFVFLAVVSLITLLLVFYDRLQPMTIGIILVIGLFTYIKRKNTLYLLITDEAIIFRNKYSVRWLIGKESVSRLEYKPVNFYGGNPERVLVSLFFICKDGDSYSMPMVYFSEEQAKEIQLTIDKIKK